MSIGFLHCEKSINLIFFGLEDQYGFNGNKELPKSDTIDMINFINRPTLSKRSSRSSHEYG